MDGLGTTAHLVCDAEHHRAATGIREAGSVFAGELQVFLGALPGLEVENVAFEVIGDAVIQTGQQCMNLECVGRWHRHVFLMASITVQWRRELPCGLRRR